MLTVNRRKGCEGEYSLMLPGMPWRGRPRCRAAAVLPVARAVAGSAAETDDGPVVTDDAVATARAGDVAVEPASSEVVASAEDSSGEPPADYGSFDSFFASVFGTSDAVPAGGERVVVTTTSSQPVPLTAGVDVEDPVEPAYQLQGGAGKPARYDSFDSFISSVFGSSSN